MSEWDDKLRFFASTIRLSIFQTLRRWIASGFRSWDRELVVYHPVYPGDPRYEHAPYSSRALYLFNQ